MVAQSLMAHFVRLTPTFRVNNIFENGPDSVKNDACVLKSRETRLSVPSHEK